VSHRSWVGTAWMRTVARCAIGCLGVLGLGSGLVLWRCASWWWEVLLLRVVGWRRVLGLSTTRRRRIVLLLLLLLLRWGRRRRRWVGLASRWRREVLLLALRWLVCRVSVETVVVSGTRQSTISAFLRWCCSQLAFIRVCRPCYLRG
jgi:hypothetical protein